MFCVLEIAQRNLADVGYETADDSRHDVRKRQQKTRKVDNVYSLIWRKCRLMFELDGGNEAEQLCI